MAKDSALFDRIENGLENLYRKCCSPASSVSSNDIDHIRCQLVDLFRDAGIDPFFKRVEAKTGDNRSTFFYTIGKPNSNRSIRRSTKDDSGPDEWVKTLGFIQECVVEWLKHLPELRNPSPISRLRDGMHGLQFSLPRLCEYAKRCGSSDAAPTAAEIKTLLEAFWEDETLIREAVKDLDSAMLQALHRLTVDDYWEINLLKQLNETCKWLMHTRLESPTTGISFNTALFTNRRLGEIPDCMPMLEAFYRQEPTLHALEQRSLAGIRLTPRLAQLISECKAQSEIDREKQSALNAIEPKESSPTEINTDELAEKLFERLSARLPATVVQVEGALSTDQQTNRLSTPPTLSDGPFAPTSFVWKGEKAKLTPIQFKIMEALWGAKRREDGSYAMHENDLIDEVWGDKGCNMANLYSHCSHIGDALLGGKIIGTVAVKSPWITLTFGSPEISCGHRK